MTLLRSKALITDIASQPYVNLASPPGKVIALHLASLSPERKRNSARRLNSRCWDLVVPFVFSFDHECLGGASAETPNISGATVLDYILLRQVRLNRGKLFLGVNL